MLDSNWLRTFVTLAEVKHFGRTAEALHMTQPNVSLHIKQLEKTTQSRLIERNPFQLTQAGGRLLETASFILNELQVCQSDLNAINALELGNLSIAASDIVSRALLIEPCQRFKTQFPGIDLSLFNTTSDQAAELVKSAKADIGFVIDHKPITALYYSPLSKIQWCALGKNPLKKENKKGLTLILLGDDTRTRRLMDSALPSLELEDVRVMEVGSVDAQIDWAEAGFGTAILPTFTLRRDRQFQQRVTLLPHFPSTEFGYILRQNQVLSKAAKQLLHWIEQTRSE
ncbi:LysR family transcriptional regulator [Veronia nyctiphanis]|uniref:LysR family transcriptional regulator n=1 Tax=Veronia nyctiphanis TaxID=1278244 RepID=A0A4Q0YNZ3_9GAMM|nr:LysR family transcriptional regulator [Veronia nyctiphanis]RXJ72710.1 LysR family transcriptional regulator [Veronia nyctiphanis]